MATLWAGMNKAKQTTRTREPEAWDMDQRQSLWVCAAWMQADDGSVGVRAGKAAQQTRDLV
jgi:hypothetical protein